MKCDDCKNRCTEECLYCFGGVTDYSGYEPYELEPNSELLQFDVKPDQEDWDSPFAH